MSVRHGMLVQSIELKNADCVEAPLDLEEVYREHARTVMRWATRLSGRPEDASDLTQEVFCVVQRKLRSFRPQTGQLTTWLFRITEHVVRARRRKERVAQWLFGTRELPTDKATTEPGPDEVLVSRRDIALVYRALEALHEDDRTALVMFELEGLSGAQVAELTGVKIGAMWVRLHRARQRLLVALQKLEPEVQR